MVRISSRVARNSFIQTWFPTVDEKEDVKSGGDDDAPDGEDDLARRFAALKRG
jgi:hypothetical protein